MSRTDLVVIVAGVIALVARARRQRQSRTYAALESPIGRPEADREALAHLRTIGADLSKPTEISSSLYFPQGDAADVGANGIIMGNIDEPGTGAKVAAAIFGTGTERNVKSVATFVASDTARVRAFCANATW